jgi:hypothetical protein
MFKKTGILLPQKGATYTGAHFLHHGLFDKSLNG